MLGKTAKGFFEMEKLAVPFLVKKNKLGGFLQSITASHLFLVLNDLTLLIEILLGSTSMNASDHWSITSGAKTRSSERFFNEVRNTSWKHSEDIYTKAVDQFQ